MLLEDEQRQKEFFDIFSGLSPVLQEYLIKTAKELLSTQEKLLNPKDNN